MCDTKSFKLTLDTAGQQHSKQNPNWTLLKNINHQVSQRLIQAVFFIINLAIHFGNYYLLK